MNGIVYEMEAILVKIDDEDKKLLFIWRLPSSYEHMKPFLVYGKVNIILLEVKSKPFSKKRRLSGRGSNISSKVSVVTTNKGRKTLGKRL